MAKKRIMVIEDDYAFAELLQLVLTGLGYEASISLGALAGLAFAGMQRPDLIILDLSMPQMNGLQVLCELKKKPLTKDIPVVVCSSHGEAQVVAAAMRCGAAAILPKTLKREELDPVLCWALAGPFVPAAAPLGGSR